MRSLTELVVSAAGLVGLQPADPVETAPAVPVSPPCSLSADKMAFNDRSADLEDLPELIYVEPVMACNLACEMCPVPAHTTAMGGRYRSIMKPEVYKKVLDSIRGRHRLVWLNQLGEPLLNKHIVDFVAWTKREGHSVAFTTNGTLMTERLAARLLEAGLDKIVFSFDGGTKETFERIRIGANFEETVANIRTFAKMARERSPACGVQVHMIVSDATEHETEAFKALWGDLVTTELIPLDDWAGQLELPEYFGKPRTPKRDMSRHACDLLWTTAYVSAEGRAMYCCHDYKQTSNLSSVMDRDLKTIWRTEIRAERDRHVRGDYAGSPCEHCAAWKTRPLQYDPPPRG